MKNQENKKPLKTSRQRFFQMLLTLGPLGPKFNLWTENTHFSKLYKWWAG